MLGQLKLPVTKNTYFTVTGGPSFDAENYPDHIFVKMAAEINVECDISVPTVDFSVPPLDLLDSGVNKAVTALLMGAPLYVGCMAGKGRTGLFLAILAKAFGVENPVAYVRANYYAHAVETAEQKRYVESYVVPKNVRKRIARRKFFQKLAFWAKGDLTNRSI